MMNESELIARMRRSAAAFWTLQSRSSNGGDALVFPGVAASITPGVADPPFFNFFNAVFYDVPSAVGRHLSEIETKYREMGIRRWMVWVLDQDTDVSADLDARGYRSSGTNCAMALEFDERAGREPDKPRAPDPVEIRKRVPIEAYTDVAERGFEVHKGAYAPGLYGFPVEEAHSYLAVITGDAVGCVMAYDCDGDCAINIVATAPEARGMGISSYLMGLALRDARERGCETSSLQASEDGQGLYQRLGYRPLGVLGLWERRVT
jgi:GNAT superfamily N-acetyltransferase